MRFRIQSIKPGYCEIWANERDGQRYQKLAEVIHEEERGTWTWYATRYEEPPFYIPFTLASSFPKRAACIADCKLMAINVLVDRAIERQPEESPHWHSPRRDAMRDVEESGLFTHDKLEVTKRRLETF